MDTRFLESFVTVASCGSIAEAARRLNLKPAAVAQRLCALEAELGHSLVSRTGRTVRPTASGLAVLAEAHALLEATRALKAAAANDMPAGQLRLGATATALTGCCPPLSPRLARTFRVSRFLFAPAPRLTSTTRCWQANVTPPSLCARISPFRSPTNG